MTGDVRGPLSVLVVEPSAAHRAYLESVLLSAGLQVTPTEMFYEGRAFLERQAPDLLITELRLGEYNGLHLVMRARTQHPTMPALIMSDWLDPVLQAEAERLRATFVPKAVASEELLAAVARTCFREPDAEGPIRAPFERRQTIRRVTSLSVDLTSERRRVDDRRHHTLSLGVVVTG